MTLPRLLLHRGFGKKTQSGTTQVWDDFDTINELLVKGICKHLTCWQSGRPPVLSCQPNQCTLKEAEGWLARWPGYVRAGAGHLINPNANSRLWTCTNSRRGGRFSRFGPLASGHAGVSHRYRLDLGRSGATVVLERHLYPAGRRLGPPASIAWASSAGFARLPEPGQVQCRSGSEGQAVRLTTTIMLPVQLFEHLMASA
jgi:hypothetical protein